LKALKGNNENKDFADEPEKFFSLLRNFLEKSNKAQIVYKPDNRLTWPKPPSEFKCRMSVATSLENKEESENFVLDYYQKAVVANVANYEVWEEFWQYFLRSKKYHAECLYALNQYEKLAKSSDPDGLMQYGHCIMVWRGQQLDLLGRRDEAVECYQTCLNNFKDVCDYCENVDRKWLETHINKPFEGS
jgi:tetratricopeptide (TPR) repeat protein